MSSLKELLILKDNIRNNLPNNNTEIGQLLLKIFTIKFKMTENDFKCKSNTTLLDNVPIEEFPLSDKQLIIIFNKSNVNTKSIYKILLEISDDNATVNYAPLLFPLISFLLCYLSHTETRNCIERLMNNSEMVPASKNDWNIFCNLLFHLGKNFATKAFKHIDKSGGTIDNKQLLYWPYFVWNLPTDHLGRIIPCYFVEGLKVFLRSGLLIWKECFTRHRNEITSTNFKELLMRTAQTIDKTYSPQQFLKRMFAIRNFGRKSIDKFRNRLPKPLPNGEWISPTASRGYIAFKRTHSNPSQIVSTDELIEIIRNLDPILSQINKPIPLFCTASHGYSLNTLYSRAENSRESLLILETAKSEVIGAFCTDSWTLKNRTEPKRYYGKGGCFVFKIRPKPNEFYFWNESNNRDKSKSEMFQRATGDSLEIGGGGQGPAISIDKDINKGSSTMSSTFNNPCLTPYSNRDFLIRSLELLAFAEITVD